MYIMVVSPIKKIGLVLKLDDIDKEPGLGSHINLLGSVVMKNSQFGCLAVKEKISNHLPITLFLSDLLYNVDVYQIFPAEAAVILTKKGKVTFTEPLAQEFGMKCPRELTIFEMQITSAVAQNYIV